MYSKRLHIHTVPIIVLAVSVTGALLVAVAPWQVQGGGMAAMFTPALHVKPAVSASGDISLLNPVTLTPESLETPASQPTRPERVILPTDPSGAAAAVQAPRTMLLLQTLDVASLPGQTKSK
jgi:hypothetical protein